MIFHKVPPKHVHILVIDDNACVRQGTVQLLKSVGYETIKAETGAQGVRLASTHSPDIIVVNVILPDINGLDLCQQLKALPACATSRIVLISEKITDSEDSAVDFEHGVEDFTVRPISDREFLARIRLIVRLKYAEENLQQALRVSEDRFRAAVVQEHTAELQAANARLEQEIAERKRTEAALRESYNNYQAFLTPLTI